MTRKEIQDKKLEINNNIMKESKRFDNKIKKLNNQLETLRKECKHPNTTFCPDPSGNNDSFYSCNDCGKESHKL